MRKRTWLIAGLVALAVAALVAVGVSTAYLTDVETADHVITVGRVSVKLTEGPPFDPDPLDPTAPTAIPVVPGSVVTKAPKLTNDGSKDEYVFLKISVPKAAVTLLYEDNEYDTSDPPQIVNHRKGTVRDSCAADAKHELFRLIAYETGDPPVTVTPASVGTSTDPAPPDAALDADVAYHDPKLSPAPGWVAGSEEGWVLLSVDTTGDDADEYVFGYNKKLAPQDETVTLFDEAQLKSFIDGEITGAVEVGVVCCGIQADNLPEGTVTSTGNYVTQDDLDRIWAILANRGVLPEP